MTRLSRILLGTCAMLLAGCGTVGSPVPPEAIGVKAKQERDKRTAEAIKLKEETGPPEVISNRPTGDALIRSR